MIGTFKYSTTIVLLFASIFAEIFGQFFVLRYPVSTHDKNTRKFTCISEDDNSALIWNTNDIIKQDDYKKLIFQPKRAARKDDENCALWNSAKCLTNWANLNGWETTNTFKEPMGPALDYRWEDFDEFIFKLNINSYRVDNIHRYVGKVNELTGTSVFSTKGLGNVHILICEKRTLKEEGFCFWIVIAGWDSSKSVIRYCPTEAPPDGESPGPGSCKTIREVSHNPDYIINNKEWRTFVLKWNNEERTIKVFRETDAEDTPFLQGEINANQWRIVSHVFVRGDRGTRVRFHSYNYLLSKNANAVISTNSFEHEDENLCIELLFGLCPDCKLNVYLVDADGHENIQLKTISGDVESFNYDKTMTWRSIRLKGTNKFQSNYVRLKFETIFDEIKSEGRWAIDNLRTCRSNLNIRESSVTIDTRMSITCQKLYYDKIRTINPLEIKIIKNDQTRTKKLINKLENICGSSCTSSRKSSSFCNSFGCTCSQGYTGDNCNEACPSKWYGYNCNSQCSCSKDNSWNKIDESCLAIRDSSGRSSPFLETILSRIDKPDVTNITDTSVKVYQKLDVENFVGIKASIIIAKAIDDTFVAQKVLKKSNYGPPIYEADITGLEKNTKYSIKTFVCHEDLLSSSHHERNFMTTCQGQPLFALKPGDRNITVTMREHTSVCDNFSNGVYHMLIYEKTRGYTKSIPFPGNFENLVPYTKYEVKFFEAGNPFLNLTTRTSESAPSKVENLVINFKNETYVTISWQPPREENGIIRHYNISFELIELLGCTDIGQPTPNINKIAQKMINQNTVSFDDLHPYATYRAIVTAHTITSGDPETIDIQTDVTTIPTSVISDLTINENKNQLHWNRPSNCTTITGPTEYTRLLFKGVSDTVLNWTFTGQSAHEYYDLNAKFKLHPFTKYEVHAHVIRRYDGPHNIDKFASLSWTTRPEAPPAVIHLQIYDADYEKSTTSLRWMPPYPPNGVLESFTVLTKKNNKPIQNSMRTISLNDENCRSSEGYVCLKDYPVPPTTKDHHTIEIYATNKDVINHGEIRSIDITSSIYKTEPSEPNNFDSLTQSHGIVTLKWSHPDLSSTKISQYHIHVDIVNTTLYEKRLTGISTVVNCPGSKNRVELHLLPSTVYKVSITSSNSLNVNSTKVEKIISLPGSIGIKRPEKLDIKRNGNLLEIQPPKILNATVHTTIYVIVNGLSICLKNNGKNPSGNELLRTNTWIAAIYKVHEIEDKPLTIGTNHNHGVDTNCSFRMGENYDIMFTINDSNSGLSVESEKLHIVLLEDNPEPSNSGLAWIIIPIIAICAILILYKYRKEINFHKSDEDILHSENPSTNPNWNLLQQSSTISLEVMNNNQRSQDSIVPDVIPYNPNSYTVDIGEFEEYTKEALASGLLVEQYAKFTRGLTKSCEYGRLKENIPKNRYKDLTAYDETRVVLQKIPGDPYSDYINASYIPGYRNDKAYIATQGPKPNTVNDFWRMIWQNEVQTICMLANVIEGGRTKCEQYWPDIGTKKEYGKILIWNIEHQVYVDYTFRRFVINYKKQEREIMHLHYTGWPDHGVPMYTQSLVPYLKKLYETDLGNAPVVVHCSAGVGRTGTIILCDTCLRQAIEEKVLDLPAATIKMRQARANMVDNVQQYLLAHLVIVESTIAEQTKIPCNILRDKIEELRERLPSDIKRLNDTVWQDRALHALAAPTRPTQNELLENEISVPNATENSNETQSSAEEFYDPKSQYLTTIGIDGMKKKNQYIVSRLITQSNQSNFWKLIINENIELIIILQRPHPEQDSNYCEIVPIESPSVPITNIKLEVKSSICNEEEHFTIDKLVLTDTSKDEATPHPVTVLTCNGWESGKDGKPPPAAALVSLWRTSEKISRQESPTFVLCRDGVTGCGLYVALSFLLERMALEVQCDVISAVRAVRRFKPEFVHSLDQFEYLYDAALNYEKSFQTYANFT